MSALVCVDCGRSPVEDSPGCDSPHLTAGVETRLIKSHKVRKSLANFIPPVVVPKAARPPKWRGRTAVELNKAGKKVRVFHRSPSQAEAWTHPYAGRKRCEACNPS